MSQYINEAFKQFRMLNESEDFTLDPMGLDNLGSFMDKAMEDADDIEIDITDIDADTEDELKKSYVGKVICECNVCHSNIFHDKADIQVDDEGIVNMEDECPYCMSNDGYTIVGEIKPYEEATEDEVTEPDPEVDLDVEVEDPAVEEPIEVEEEKVEESLEDEDENLEEGLQLSGEKELKGTSDLRHREDKDGVDAIKGKNNSEISGDLDLHESIDEEELPKEDNLTECNEKEDETLTEDVEHIQLNSEDSTIDIGQKDDGGIVIETSPALEAEEPADDVSMSSDDEMIAPLDDDTVSDLGLEDEPALDDSDDLDLSFDDETSAEDEESEDVDVDEFDEDSFDGLGESYLRRCYENVNGFKTTKVTCNENKLMVEGNISFKSGNTKKTNFIFEAKETSNGKYMFEGYNEQINIGKNAFKLNCSLDNKKLISESLAYNYSSKNELNESVKLSGTVKSHRKAK